MKRFEMVAFRRAGIRWSRTGAMPRSCHAQQYPNQDIHFICAFPAGSGADVLVRYFAEKLRPLIGRHGHRREQGRRRRQHRDRIRRAVEARRLHDLRARGQHGRASACICSRTRRSIAAKAIQVAATINRQPFMLVVDAKSPSRPSPELTAAMKAKGDKATYGSRGAPARSWARSTRTRPACRRSRSIYKTAPDSLNDIAQRHDRLRHARSGVLARAGARGTAAHPRASATGATARREPGPADHDRDRASRWISSAGGRRWCRRKRRSRSSTRSTSGSTRSSSADDTKKFLNSFGGDPCITTPEKAQATVPQGHRGLGRLRAGSPRSSRKAEHAAARRSAVAPRSA